MCLCVNGPGSMTFTVEGERKIPHTAEAKHITEIFSPFSSGWLEKIWVPGVGGGSVNSHFQWVFQRDKPHPEPSISYRQNPFQYQFWNVQCFKICALMRHFPFLGRSWFRFKTPGCQMQLEIRERVPSCSVLLYYGPLWANPYFKELLAIFQRTWHKQCKALLALHKGLQTILLSTYDSWPGAQK